MNSQIYEVVGRGHPDKLCDKIADNFCALILKQDEEAKVACEVMATNEKIVFGGEIHLTKKLDIDKIQKEAVEKLNVLKPAKYKIYNMMQQQSLEINNAVEQDGMIGAGDQGICVGHACLETPEYLPKVQVAANYIIKEISNFVMYDNRYSEKYGLDMKLILMIEQIESFPYQWIAKKVIFAIQHKNNLESVRYEMKLLLIYLLSQQNIFVNNETIFQINNGGTFHLGGIKADTGLTGRKIACDNFAGVANGGGAFSGKDWSKVDRTGTYLARYIAKNILENNKDLYTGVIVRLVYAIGEYKPEVYVNDEKVNIEVPNLTDVINDYRSWVSVDELTYNHWNQIMPWEQVEINKKWKLDGGKKSWKL